MKLLLIGMIVVLINIPFGYWRTNVRKLSMQWILAIHIPVALVIALRLLTHLGFAWYTYFVMVFAFFTGQQLGAIIHRKMEKNDSRISSCMVMDIFSRYHTGFDH